MFIVAFIFIVELTEDYEDYSLEAGIWGFCRTEISTVIIVFNPCGWSDKLIVLLDSAKMAERRKSKNAEQSFASNISNFELWREATFSLF